jgi:hypothetical protein
MTRLILAFVLVSGVLLISQTRIGPTAGLLVPVWDSLYNRYAMLTVGEFKAILSEENGVRYQMPTTPPALDQPFTGGRANEQMLSCSVPVNKVSTCTWR